MNPAEERETQARGAKPKADFRRKIEISVPREVGTYDSDDTVPDPDRERVSEPETRIPAYIRCITFLTRSSASRSTESWRRSWIQRDCAS